MKASAIFFADALMLLLHISNSEERNEYYFYATRRGNG